MASKTENRHDYLMDEGSSYRHWSPNSEKFATTESLLNALESGWQIDGVVFRQEHWHRGGRRVPVYHFKLIQNSEVSHMVVVQNPVVDRLLTQFGVQVVLVNQRKPVGTERW